MVKENREYTVNNENKMNKGKTIFLGSSFKVFLICCLCLYDDNFSSFLRTHDCRFHFPCLFVFLSVYEYILRIYMTQGYVSCLPDSQRKNNELLFKFHTCVVFLEFLDFMFKHASGLFW